jgi:regulator of sigma E protease
MSGLFGNIAFFVLPILIILGVVVTVHELGHFLAARALGAKVERFSIGFGRAIAAWRDRAGVEWRIGWVPLGGYVKFAGDENAASVPDQDDLESLRRDIVAREGPGALNRYFHFKPLWQRAIIVAAGPVANFLLSIAIFAALLFAFGEPIVAARAAMIDKGSPAERAGIQPGDLIVRADGKAIDSFYDLRMIVLLRSGTPIPLVVERAGRQVSLTVTPERAAVKDQLGHVQHMGTIGVRAAQPRPNDVHIRRYGPLEALRGGVAQTWDRISTTVLYLGRMITGRETTEQLSGPLGMAQLSGELAKRTAEASPTPGVLAANIALTIVEMIANISVGIGFLNLLPVPVLDGGHLVFYAYEAVARRPPAARIQAAGFRVGLALVLGLMLFATWNDLQRLNVLKLFGALFS